MKLAVLLPLLLTLAEVHAQTVSSEAGGALSQFTVARFGGSGSTSIRAMTSDAAGNIYVAGTTSSLNLPVKNAAQAAFAETAIMRSLDRGLSWQRIPNPPVAPIAMALHPSAPAVVVIAASDGLYKTADAGRTWRHVYTPGPSGFGNEVGLAFDPRHDNVIHGCSDTVARGGWLTSTDGGDTWQADDAPTQQSFFCSTLWVDPAGTGTVGLGRFLSRDKGRTWSEISAPTASPLNRVIPDPHHAGWLFAGMASESSGALYLSKDWGSTWQKQSSPSRQTDGTSVAIRALQFDPDIPGTIYVLDADGRLGISDNSGGSWRSMDVPLKYLSGSLAVLSKMCGGGGILLVSDSTVASSTDFGTTWPPAGSLNAVSQLATGPGCEVLARRTLTADAFVAKLAPGGTQVVWSTYLGGSRTDEAAAIAVDALGNVYVAGTTWSSDFAGTESGPLAPGHYNAFAVKYGPNGDLRYATNLGDVTSSGITGLGVNTRQEAHLVGWTDSRYFQATPGAIQMNPGGRDGFLVKLAADGSIHYATYLPEYAPTVSAGALYWNEAKTVGVAAETSGTVLVGGYGGRLARVSADGSELTPLPKQRGHIYSMEADSQGNIYIAGQASTGVVGQCSVGLIMGTPFSVHGGDIFVTKLEPETLTQVYSTSISGSCQSRPGQLRIGPAGEVTLGAWSLGGFPTVNPAMLARSCTAVARINSDGSAQTYGSYLDMCAGQPSSAPPVAVAADGPIYAGVTASYSAAVLRLPVPAVGGLMVESAFDSLSGGTPNRGALITITGRDLAARFIDLGLNDPDPLPYQLGGVQVLFDGAPARMFQVAPDHAIALVPASVANRTATVQVRNASFTSSPAIVEIYAPYTSFLTRHFPNRPPSGSVDGNIRNQDGTLNDAEHPAALGSTVTLFATGLAGPGPVALYWNAPAPARSNPSILTPIYGNARLMPGFIDALYAIDFRIPDKPALGIGAVPVPGVLTRAEIGTVGSGLGVWIR